MMNYASAAVTLKNAITSVIRQMGLFCLAYAVHLLRVSSWKQRHKHTKTRHEDGLQYESMNIYIRMCTHCRFSQCLLPVEDTQKHHFTKICKKQTNIALGSKIFLPVWCLQYLSWGAWVLWGKVSPAAETLVYYYYYYYYLVQFQSIVFNWLWVVLIKCQIPECSVRKITTHWQLT